MTRLFHDHFSKVAATYAAFRPAYPPELGTVLADAVSTQECALDCGCGTGQLATLLANHFASVIATDASDQQILHAQPHPRVRYRTAAAEASGLDGASVDLVTAAQAAHWFNLDAFYAEVRRVLNPGGAVALITYGTIEIDGPVGEAIDRFYVDVLGPFWPPERRYVETHYRDLPFPFPERPVPALSMHATWPVDAVIEYVATWSATNRAAAALGPGPFQRFTDDVRSGWPGARRALAIRWPLTVRIGSIT